MIKVHLGGSKLLIGCSELELEKIKDDLTFDNPKYLQALQHSQYGAPVRIPKYIYYYTEGKEGILVPRGYVIPFPYEIVTDNRVVNTGVEFPLLRMNLRKTQAQAVRHFLLKNKDNENESGVIVLPTGKGKSILGLYLAYKLKQRALIIVQKDDLVDGWTKDIQLMFGVPTIEVGKIKGKKFFIGKHFTITTIQTLSKVDSETLLELQKTFGMVIVDEFHRSVANIYKLVEYMPARYKIGLTATAMRNDGLGDVLYLVFGKKAYEFKDTMTDEDILPVNIHIRTARTKWTAPVEYRHNGKRIPVAISHVRKAIANDRAFNTLLAKDVIREVSNNRSCIVFTHEKEHCSIIRQNLIDRGIPENIIQIYSGDSKIPKDEMKQKAETREVLITIATYSIATEGTNVKAWERGFLASSIANEKDTVQAIGRVRRTLKGKENCVIYDYRFPDVSVAKNHGFIRDKVYKKYNYNILTGGENSTKVTKENRRKERRGFRRITN